MFMLRLRRMLLFIYETLRERKGERDIEQREIEKESERESKERERERRGC